MIANIEKLPGNNFKKGAELEIKKVIEIADQMKIDRDDEISLKFYACWRTYILNDKIFNYASELFVHSDSLYSTPSLRK